MMRYLEDGRIRIDNNLAENAIHPSHWEERTTCSAAIMKLP